MAQKNGREVLVRVVVGQDVAFPKPDSQLGVVGIVQRIESGWADVEVRLLLLFLLFG